MVTFDDDLTVIKKQIYKIGNIELKGFKKK